MEVAAAAQPQAQVARDLPDAAPRGHVVCGMDLLEAIEALRFPREFDGVRTVTRMGTLEPSAGLVGPATTTGPDRLDLVSADNRLISTLGNASRMLGRAGTARATVVLISQGMPVGLSDDYRRSVHAQGSWTLLRRYDEWRQVLDRVQRSGVTMHVIDPTGFDPRMARRVSTDARLAGPTARMREAMATDDTRSASRVIADRSGGITVVDPDPTGAAQRVLAVESRRVPLWRCPHHLELGKWPLLITQPFAQRSAIRM